jgi:hypothetical protein
MVRRETPRSSAAWSSETLRPIRGATLCSDTLSDNGIDPPEDNDKRNAWAKNLPLPRAR